MKVSKGTIARTAILVLTIINSGLAIFGKARYQSATKP